MGIVVYKIGGSLLTLPDLASRLDRLLSSRPADDVLFVSGGGAAADLVRDWDRRFSLGQARAHWLALEAVALNEALLLQLLPDALSVRSRDEAETAWRQGKPALLCARDALRDAEARTAGALPKTWDVTSDSIAAWIALDWSADELVLLKSDALPVPCTLLEAAERGLVDAFFPTLATKLPRIRWIDLRESSGGSLGDVRDCGVPNCFDQRASS